MPDDLDGGLNGSSSLGAFQARALAPVVPARKSEWKNNHV